MGELNRMANLVINLQNERSAIAYSLFMSLKSGEKMDISKYFAKTDEALNIVSTFLLYQLPGICY